MTTQTPPDTKNKAMNEQQKERVRGAIAESLGDAYDCTRCWSAWSYGTMSQNDFVMVAEDAERIEEILDAVMASMSEPNTPHKGPTT